MGKKSKAKPRRRSAPRDLTASGTMPVKGGGLKAGDSQQKYMTLTLENTLISNYSS